MGKAFYDRVGGVDASLWYGTDMDFFLRGILAGGKIALDPRLQVVHDHPLNTFLMCWKKAYSYGRIQVDLLRLHYGSRFRWPGYPRWVAPKYLLPWQYAILGTETWFQQREVFQTTKKREQKSLVFWLFARYWAVGIAYRLGALVSMLKEPSFDFLREKRVTYGKR